MYISEPEPAPAGEPTDIELVVRIQAGDDAAFDVLMGRYKRPVLSFVYRMTGGNIQVVMGQDYSGLIHKFQLEGPDR